MNKYQEAIGWLYSTFMYEPMEYIDETRKENIEKLNILNELVFNAKPLIPYYKMVKNNLRPYCGKCGLRLKRTWSVCPRCENKIDWRNV